MPDPANTATAPLRINLALTGDGAEPAAHTDSLGEITLGTRGLLRVLEAQMGIPTDEVSFTTRLIQYLACVEAGNHPQTFYHQSYQADPFSVARTLLQWRDQWYLGGWTGTFDETLPPEKAPGTNEPVKTRSNQTARSTRGNSAHKGALPARLRDLAALEQTAQAAVAPGIGQRVQRLIALIADHPLAIDVIVLRDPLAAFPPLWQRLLEILDAPLEEQPAPNAAAAAGTDLGLLQQRLLEPTGTPVKLAGDGSVQVLRADCPPESGPVVERLCHQWQAQSPDTSIAVLAETRGNVLDDTLESRQHPRLGFTELSPWRPVFQVLPLALELLWEPLDPAVLFQFLSHPVGPIPRQLRSRLATAVANTPGIDSADWRKALDEGVAREDPARRERLLADVQYWLATPRFAPEPGVDSATLSARARRVADWLQGAREASDEPAFQALYTIALNQATEFSNAVERLRDYGRDPLSRDNVRRLIDDVRGRGAPATDRGAEIRPGQRPVLRSDHAGAFHNPIDYVIWWDCQAGDRVPRWPWSKTERSALAAAGVTLQTENEQWGWLGQAWLRPILSARHQLLLVLHDDAERHHPIYDQLVSVAEGLQEVSISDPGTLVGLGITPEPLQATRLPSPVRWWQLPADTAIPEREAESYSSLDAGIHSPYQWLLRYSARLRPGSLANVSDGNLLKGNLAHRLYQWFFEAHPTLAATDSQRIIAWVDRELPLLLQQEGALLLTPGRQAECQRFIVQIRESLVALVEHLKAADTKTVSTELWQEGRFVGGPLTGSIDLLAIRADGREAVVDIKWSGRKYRREALLANDYLQLAVYAKLRRDQVGEAPALSYFIVTDAHMLSLSHSFFPNAEVIQPIASANSDTGSDAGSEESNAQYWRRIEQSWRWRRTQLDAGRIEVTVAGTEPDALSLSNPDGLHMPETSDRFNDYRALTGWEEGA